MGLPGTGTPESPTSACTGRRVTARKQCIGSRLTKFVRDQNTILKCLGQNPDLFADRLPLFSGVYHGIEARKTPAREPDSIGLAGNANASPQVRCWYHPVSRSAIFGSCGGRVLDTDSPPGVAASYDCLSCAARHQSQSPAPSISLSQVKSSKLQARRNCWRLSR
jgi:hypothetical protein